ncbi:CBM96 family carbohydrate-binding protein [Dyadobacter sandarakinus]|uniref:DNRLRE domain-containing protein n=1 Tax=Dyadobacter sandarakinus TaxID=2747268 RepID=A0ABX7I682_9BACT|nr:DNRLRE domain-containing protein [Dyadobacter sandarakinus]QRR01395.1 DNRLRE domain-containing protein [Dyadobacter sandarakinus]
MKRILQLVLLLAGSTIPAWSQTCSVPVLKTQADVDNFSTSYPGCTVITSDLEISSSSITNLDGLRGITRINRSLKINYNPRLKSIEGLSSLTQIDASINIEDNDSLLNLEGLQHLVSLQGSIRVVEHQRLTSLEGLRGMTRILGSMSIGSNPALTSLNGLNNVTRVRGVSIGLNDKLVDLNGLRRLKEVNSPFYIGKNKSLKSLKGLERLEIADDRIEITENTALTSISELAQLKTVSHITITNNPLLSDCAIGIVCARAAFDQITISGNAAGCTSNQEVRMSTACMPQTLVRINAGGPDFTTATQKLFVADQYYAGIDRTSSIASGDILNTTNDVLYRSGRCSPSFSYNIPVVNDQVNVTLHFAETYFGAPGKKGGAGSRQFNVNIEGSRKLTNYDIFTEAGGALRAVQLTFPVTVTNGVLNIDFLTGAADLPRVAAIEVTASPTLIPLADGLVSGGVYSNSNYVSTARLSVKQVPSGGNQNANRLSYLKFQLPTGKAVITSAKLRIYGHNNENNTSIAIHAYGVNNDSWTEQAITGDNAPAASTSSLGSAAVNDVYKYHEIDVTSYVNAQRQSGDVSVSFLLNDPNKSSTEVVFNSKEAGTNPPQLIYQTTNVVQTPNSSARLGQEEVVAEIQEEQHSTVFPNPVKDHFTVSLSPEHAGPITFEMFDAAGNSHAIPAPQNSRPGEDAGVNLAGRSLNAGVYLLKIKSDAFAEVVKMIIAK